ncbi:MAG: L-serine ammonia-lyase, iron-sulfur-dependent, subunit alpha [Oscillospiraceae bacterium]|nr:L-serine ammonia-lyase, iron-sulfur-dependent, subunit alpha [Oscillospiraceae bacterium]
MIFYRSVAELARQAGEKNISDLVLAQQAAQLERPAEDIYREMAESFTVMKQSVSDGVAKDIRSASGLSGGNAWKMQRALEGGLTLCGPIFASALVKALAVSELNACMGRIVAAPTAGSCGILPAAVLSLMEARDIPEEKAVMSLFTAAGVGMVIANNASVSGAEGGCQAECGSASAMAAAALVEMCGGTPDMVCHSVAIALKNVLGLVCDPVAGLVEAPCVKRNASGVANAFTAAELALAGIESVIPVDEVILAMKRVGDAMPSSLKETAEGGLAATPTAAALRRKIFGA